jgi:hypothetical protein
MQNILDFFNLYIAKATPTDIVAGNAGGTVIVTKSRDFASIKVGYVPIFIRAGRVAINPPIPTKAIIPTKIIESL